MVAPNQAAVIHYSGPYLSHADASDIARVAMTAPAGQVVHLCLNGAADTSTAALARLIVLRRNLLSHGSDLRIVGLNGRARHLYDVNRLSSVLPATEPNESELIQAAGMGGTMDPSETEASAPAHAMAYH